MLIPLRLSLFLSMLFSRVRFDLFVLSIFFFLFLLFCVWLWFIPDISRYAFWKRHRDRTCGMRITNIQSHKKEERVALICVWIRVPLLQQTISSWVKEKKKKDKTCKNETEKSWLKESKKLETKVLITRDIVVWSKRLTLETPNGIQIETHEKKLLLMPIPIFV